MTELASPKSEAVAPMQNLLQDEAYLLQSRGVVKLEGEQALEALQSLCSNSLANVGSKVVLSYILDEDNYLLADVFVVSHKGGLLVECEKTFIAPLLELLSRYCDGADLSAKDCSDQWRVMAQGPDQSTFKEGGAYIKYVDPRWHMGTRLLRPTSDAPSYHWGSELKWQGHAHKLGVLPGAHAVSHWGITPREANLHSQQLLDAACVDTHLAKQLAEPTSDIARRVLPLRIEPDAFSFPDMTGQAVTAGDSTLGTVIEHHGLYALVLVELAPWRKALQVAQPLVCAGQQVLITWPSWLARESQGRAGPVAVAGTSGG